VSLNYTLEIAGISTVSTSATNSPPFYTNLLVFCSLPDYPPSTLAANFPTHRPGCNISARTNRKQIFYRCVWIRCRRDVSGPQKTPLLCCCTIVVCMSVAAGTCLPGRSLETAGVYLLISRSLHSNGCTRHNIIRRFTCRTPEWSSIKACQLKFCTHLSLP
jgi:hypothetical protein